MYWDLGEHMPPCDPLDPTGLLTQGSNIGYANAHPCALSSIVPASGMQTDLQPEILSDFVKTSYLTRCGHKTQTSETPMQKCYFLKTSFSFSTMRKFVSFRRYQAKIEFFDGRILGMHANWTKSMLFPKWKTSSAGNQTSFSAKVFHVQIG